jgi:flagellar biosynthesis regulator FlaF
VHFVSRDRQLVMNCQAHVISLAFMVLRAAQSVTHEMSLAQRLVARCG